MGDDEKITIHHCLWIDNTSRNPKIKANIEYANNVIYNWGQIGIQGGHSAGITNKDIIGNYFIAGPNSSANFMGNFTATDHVYIRGNYLDTDKNGELNGRLITVSDIEKLTATVLKKRCLQSNFKIESAKNAFKKVINEAGDSKYRDGDEEDKRLINEVASLGTKGEILKSDNPLVPLGS